MDVLALLPNVIAMVMAGVATYTFVVAALRTEGGQLSIVLKLLTPALLLSVLLHSGVELAAALGLIEGRLLLWIMGGLIAVGSALFALAGMKLLKTLG